MNEELDRRAEFLRRKNIEQLLRTGAVADVEMAFKSLPHRGAQLGPPLGPYGVVRYRDARLEMGLHFVLVERLINDPARHHNSGWFSRSVCERRITCQGWDAAPRRSGPGSDWGSIRNEQRSNGVAPWAKSRLRGKKRLARRAG
jgi:hypothetical protein